MQRCRTGSLRLVARTEADQDQRVSAIVDVDLIGVWQEVGSVEHGADERDVRRQRHVRLELAGAATRLSVHRSWTSEIASTGGSPSSARIAPTAGSAGASISTSGPARNNENAAWNSATVGTPDASPAHNPPMSMASTSSTSAGSRSSSSRTSRATFGAEPQLLRHERHLGVEVERERGVVVRGVHERTEPPTVAPAALVDRTVTEQPNVVAAAGRGAG